MLGISVACLTQAAGCEPLCLPTRLITVLQSAGRTNTRAGWAAQVARDAGLQRCLVLRQGVYGWRLDPAVKPYRGYRLQDVPPEAEPFTVELLNVEAGRRELASLHIPVM